MAAAGRDCRKFGTRRPGDPLTAVTRGATVSPPMDSRDQPPGSAPPDPAADTVSTIADVTLFAQMFDVSAFPSVVSRLSDATVIAINRRTAEIFGQSQQAAIGQKVTDYYVDPSQRAHLAERLTRDGRADHLRMQIRRADGTPFWALFSARLVTYEGERAVLTAFTDISDQVHTETILKASEQRLAAQSHALTTLTARYADPSEPSGDRLRGILGTCAATLLVDRVSMWRFTADRRAIECVGMYERPTDRYQCEGRLERQDCLSYFDALENERVIAAHDACSDRRTSVFGATYLAEHHIGAMLDVPLRQNNVTIGVLCVEHVGGVRTWTADEQNFVISVANLIAVALADDDRRRALTRLAESDLRANLVIETAHDAFVGMDAEGRIVTWNAQAEKTFGWSRDEALGLSMADTLVPARYREAHKRGVERFHRTGDAPVVNQRLELAADRNHDHVADAAGEGHVLRGVPARHLGAARTRGPAPRGQGDGRGRHARQERVPGQHEPRTAYAAQRRARLRTAAAARPQPERRAAGGTQRHHQVRVEPARVDQ
jgi:PAS domain S-box-containing protein